MIRVLIVEDDPMVASINKEYIERLQGFTLLGVAKNGQEALLRLQGGEQVDLLILDVYMPLMNGLEMLEQVRASFKNVDVIFVTAAKERQIIQRGLELGAVDYLIKPFTFERIRQAMEKYLRRFQLLEQDHVDQADIDRLFAAGDTPEPEYPKGIHPMTLDQVSRLVEEAPSGQLSLGGMAQALGITLVTLRVYLDYLTVEGRLIKKSRHGSVGRPMYTYSKP